METSIDSPTLAPKAATLLRYKLMPIGLVLCQGFDCMARVPRLHAQAVVACRNLRLGPNLATENNLVHVLGNW